MRRAGIITILSWEVTPGIISAQWKGGDDFLNEIYWTGTVSDSIKNIVPYSNVVESVQNLRPGDRKSTLHQGGGAGFFCLWSEGTWGPEIIFTASEGGPGFFPITQKHLFCMF